MNNAMIDPNELPLFSTLRQVARLLAVNPRTIRRMIEAGRLSAVRTSARGGHLRIPRAALLEWLKNSAA